MGVENKKSRRASVGVAILACIVSNVCCNDAFAYIRSLSQSGMPLYWSSSALTLFVNPINNSGLSENSLTSLVSSSVASWNTGESSAQMGINVSVANPRYAASGMNTLFFATASNRDLGFNVIGMTEITYFVSDGRMSSVDVTLNDEEFIFTGNVGDTGQVLNNKTKIYLPDVVTHELGHVWGFDHSAVHRSSLVFTAFSGQFVLGPDDRAAIRTVYPANGIAGTQGTISGTVLGLNGGIFGAHVEAISLETGEVEASALSEPDGTFRIGILPPGSYAVMVEPMLTSLSSVSLYYANVDHRFCGGGRKFRRMFYSACGGNGAASAVAVSAGSITEVGMLAPSCTEMVNAGLPPSQFLNPKEIPASGGAFFARMDVGQEHFYRVRGIQGAIRARALSYTIYSPLDVSVELLDSNGQPVPGALAVDDVASPMPGGFINFDSSVVADNLSLGDYWIRVRSKNNYLSSQLYPAGGQLLDPYGFYLVSVGVNGSYGAPIATDMTACVSLMNARQSAFTIARTPSQTRVVDVGGACGSLIVSGKDKNGGGPGRSLNFSLVFTVALLSLWACRLRRHPVS